MRWKRDFYAATDRLARPAWRGLSDPGAGAAWNRKASWKDLAERCRQRMALAT